MKEYEDYTHYQRYLQKEARNAELETRKFQRIYEEAIRNQKIWAAKCIIYN